MRPAYTKRCSVVRPQFEQRSVARGTSLIMVVACFGSFEMEIGFAKDLFGLEQIVGVGDLEVAGIARDPVAASRVVVLVAGHGVRSDELVRGGLLVGGQDRPGVEDLRCLGADV